MDTGTNNFKCDCSGTGYEGENCSIGMMFDNQELTRV